MGKNHYELVILGGGPAGLTAGLYAARARIDHVMIEKGAPGGQVLLTDWVDNYPGFPEGVSGFDLMEKMTAHAKRFDLNTITREVKSVVLDDPDIKKLIFIEAYERVESPSLTGKLVYPITDLFALQWEEQKKHYPKGKVLGQIL